MASVAKNLVLLASGLNGGTGHAYPLFAVERLCYLSPGRDKPAIPAATLSG